jgi:hypothetical protein
MIEALLAVITVLIIALCVSIYFVIVLQGSKTSLEDDKENLGHILMSYRKNEEKQIENLLGGIDGVTSVTLSPIRYLELVKAEEDLAEYRLKIKRIGDYHE